MFGCTQCDLEVPDGLKYKFSNFQIIFKDFNVSQADIGIYMKDYAFDNNLLNKTATPVDFKLQFGEWISHDSFNQFLP